VPKSNTPAAIKSTTMRIPEPLLKRADKVAKRQDRSRSWLVNKYIEDGLKRDEKPGALD
jgi:predicted transcriptional regulator